MFFLSRNKLFKHLRETYRKFKISFEAVFDVAALIINNADVITIIHFIAKLRDVIAKSGYNFRNWKYVIFKIRYLSDFDAEESNIFSNSECEVTLDDRAYFLKNVFELEIRKMISLISIRGVENKIVSTNKYVMMIAYINEIINNIIKTVCFTMKIYFINDFKVNILFETNIMTF